MIIPEEIKDLFNKFTGQKPKKREMKRVFQWRRYLDWKDLTSEEKISAKRFLLIPLFAYVILGIFNQNFSLIVLLLVGYLLYTKSQKGKIQK